MTKEKKLQLSLFINLLIVLFELMATDYDYKLNGMDMFLYYTHDSNIFAGIVSLIYCGFSLTAVSQNRARGIVSGQMVKKYKGVVPFFVKLLRYIATCCLSLTFIVVLFLLGPNEGYQQAFLGNAHIISHLGAPVLSFISLCFFENDIKLPKGSELFAVLATVIYFIPIIIMNITRRIVGPYFFFHIYEQSFFMTAFYFIIVFGMDYLISIGIRKLHDARVKD